MLTNVPVNVKAPPAAAILESTGLVDGFFRYAVGTRSLNDLARLWWTLRRWKPDVLVYLGSARGVGSAQRDERFFRLCGIRRIIGMTVTEEMQKNSWDEAERGVGARSDAAGTQHRRAWRWAARRPRARDLHLTSAEKARADAALGRSEACR
jgi:hypothetical protein